MAPSEKLERAKLYRLREATALRAADVAKGKHAKAIFLSAATHYADLASLMERWIEPERLQSWRHLRR